MQGLAPQAPFARENIVLNTDILKQEYKKQDFFFPLAKYLIWSMSMCMKPSHKNTGKGEKTHQFKPYDSIAPVLLS